MTNALQQSPTEFPTVTVNGRSEALALAVFLADSGYVVDTQRLRPVTAAQRNAAENALYPDATGDARRAHDALSCFAITFYAAVRS